MLLTYTLAGYTTHLFKSRQMFSLLHPKERKSMGAISSLVQAGRLRRPEVVVHVLCVLRALQRTQNTQNVYKRIICGVAATCVGLLPLQFEKPCEKRWKG